MGVDITLHIEVKIAGRWEHYGRSPDFRDYALFSLMGKGWNGPPIAEPRGMPEDASAVTRVDYDFWRGNCYSPSWLSSQEVAELVRRHTPHPTTRPVEWWSTDYFGYLFQSDSWTEVELPAGVEDFRFVFWFDQ